METQPLTEIGTVPTVPMQPLATVQAEPSQIAVNAEPGGWLRVIEKMIDKGVPMEQLDKLLEMQQKWEREQARKAYVAALSAFKANAPILTKNKRVGFESKDKSQKVSYTHITLAEACRVLIPSLAQHGLSHGWETEQIDGGLIKVTCRLSHSAGHSEVVTLKSIADNSGSKNAIQAVASTVSYLERYTFLAIVGMAAEDMDDDAQATTTTIGEDVVREADRMLNDSKRERGKFFSYASKVCGCEVTMLEEITVKGWPTIRQMLKDAVAVAKNGGAA